MSNQSKSKMVFKIHKLIISFKKSLINHSSQSILEYSLLLVAVAALSLAIIWPRVCNGQNNIFTSVVDKINQRITGSP